MELSLVITIRLLIAAYTGMGIWLTKIVVQKAGFGWFWALIVWIPGLLLIVPGLEFFAVLAIPVPIIFCFIFSSIIWPKLADEDTAGARVLQETDRTLGYGEAGPRTGERVGNIEGPTTPRSALRTATDLAHDLTPVAWLLTGFDASGRVVRLELPDSDLTKYPDGFIVGRGPNEAQLVIRDESVSRQHARLYLRRGKLVVGDMGSSNGTIVDGDILRPRGFARLEKGVTVEFGVVKLTVSRG